MNEEVLLHTHYRALYIYLKGLYRILSVNTRKRYTSLFACDAKNPTGHLFHLIISFFFSASLTCRLSRRRRRRPGGRLPEDIKATTKRVEKTTVTLRVCLVKTWAHLFLQGECRSKQRSPLFPCPASKWPTNHSNKRNTRSIVYIYNSWIILASQYVYIPRKFIFMCV